MRKYSSCNSAILCLFILLIGVSACSTNKYQQFSEQVNARKNITNINPPAINTSGFVPVELIAHDIFSLSENQKKDFLKYFNSSHLKHIRPHFRVGKYLEEFSEKFTYHGNTYTAAEAFEKQTGNCLSLAILSSAFANLANLQYRYKRVFSAPVFQEYDSILLISSHLNLTLFDAPRVDTVYSIIPSALTIDYFKMPGSISTEYVSAKLVEIMYWHNLASEAILENELDLAFAYALKAFNLDSLNAETLNIIAILYKRKGQNDEAYALYEYMLANHVYSFTTLDNFSILLREKGELARANSLNLQTQHISEDNPYTWVNRGKQALKQSNFKLAKKYLKQGAKMAPYLHEPHFYLAQVYAYQNKMGMAQKELQKAKELAYLPEDQKRYQAKLYSLND